MKKTLCILLAVALLGTTACSADISFDAGQTETDTNAEAETGTEAETEQGEKSGSSDAKILDGRWLNSDIIGNVTEDTPAELKDDFALYVNKEWDLNAELPDGFASITSLGECELTIQDRMKKLLTDDSLTGHDAQLVHKLYALVTDWDYRDSLGVEPAKPYMEAIENISDLNTLYSYMCSEDNLMQFFPFTANVDSDEDDQTVYILYIDPQGLTLSPETEYKERTERGDILYTEAEQHSVYMLQRLGYKQEEAQTMFENAMAYEAMLAERILEAEEADSETDHFTLQELVSLSEGFPIEEMLSSLGYSGDLTICMNRPLYFEKLKEVFTEENVTLIRDWFAAKTATEMADLLDKETSQGIARINAGLAGVETEAKEENLALYTVAGNLPIPMDNLYIRAYCSEEQKEEILQIVEEFKVYYREMLEKDVDWLSEETKEKAIEKLDCMRVNAVYPDTLEDWSGLDFAGPEEGGSLLEARKAIERFRVKKEAEKLKTSADPYAWNQMMLPASSVNAAYTPYNNSINIQAGILNGVIYNEDMSYEQKLGGIGMVIGHEISHAFDTNGAEYDKDGEKKNWWTDADRAAFEERVAKLITWYDGFVPAEGGTYSGDRVKTEAIADMTSMKCLLYIARQTEGFDYDAFFRQYAKLWRDQSTPENVREILLMDAHPAHYLRINATLAQFEDFDDFYGIKEGDGMYLPPEDCVAVW